MSLACDRRFCGTESLKCRGVRSDSKFMVICELECPVCSADIPLAGDEKKGEELVCVFCGAPFRLTADVKIGKEVEYEDEF